MTAFERYVEAMPCARTKPRLTGVAVREREKIVATKLDEISLAIGHLQATVTGNRSAAEAQFGDLHSKIDHVVANLEKLPPSPACIEAHRSINARIADMQLSNARTAGFAGALGIFAGLVLQWLAKWVLVVLSTIK